MTILVLGASGATGRLLAEQLLRRGKRVRVIVRSPEGLPEGILGHENLSVVQASILDIDERDLVQHVTGCEAVASCLGHRITFRGVFGPPWRLVTEATRRLCQAIEKAQPEKPVRFVLMNTAGNSNRDLEEEVSVSQKVVIALLRLLVPPHADNEQAADFLRTRIGQQNPFIEWVAVRPDTLADEPKVSDYSIHPSPTRSAIFNAGTTSRINVAHFMAELIVNDEKWREWRGRMPVVYNPVDRGQ